METLTESIRGERVPLAAIFGLDQNKPGPDPGNRFFFSTPLLTQRLSIMKQMVGRGSMVMVVIGERGSGKTTLMHEYMSATEGQWKPCRIKLKSHRKNSRRRSNNLDNRVAFRTGQHRQPSIIIDDAHQLSPSELKKLLGSAFKKDRPPKFRSIVFLAEPRMRERLSEIARWLPPKSVVDKMFMTPFTEQQTTDYLKHRLRSAGRVLQNPFTAGQLRKIHNRSGGLPGRINGEAFLLLKKMNPDHQPFRQSLPAILLKWQKSMQWRLKHSAAHFNMGKKFGFHHK